MTLAQQRRRLAVLGLAAVLSCNRTPRVERPGTPYTADVVVHGNRAIDDDALISGLSAQRAARIHIPLDPYQLTQDVARIEGLYQRRGFFDVKVLSTIDLDGDAATVVFTVVEGVRARLARVEIHGAPYDAELTPQSLRDLIAIRDGKPFDYEAYDAAKPAILAAIQEAGYARASVEMTAIADRARHEAVIRIVVTPGMRCSFGEVRFAGVTGKLADAARARFAIRPGARFTPSAVSATRASLYELGRFAIVRVEPVLDGGDAVVPVQITVTPIQQHEVRLGGGIGVDQLTWQLRTRTGYTQTGVLDDLTTLNLEFRPAIVVPQHSFVPTFDKPQPRLEGQISLRRIDLFVPRLTGELALTAQYLELEAYTVYGPRLRAGISTLLFGHALQLATGAAVWLLGFSAPNAALDAATIARLGLDHSEKVVALDQSAVVDLRDNVLDPKRGFYAALRLVEGVPNAVGNLQFVQATPEVRGYVPLGRYVVSARAKLGVITGSVPVTERFYGGGAASNRGFAERELSPQASQMVDGNVESVVIGGAGEFETSLEIRRGIGSWRKLPLTAAVFLDGGNVTDSASELSPTRLYWAAGAGLRVLIGPVPVRFDLAYRLNRTGSGDPLAAPKFFDRISFHLGIGEAF